MTIDLEALSRPMTGERCHAEPYRDSFHDVLRHACAEDSHIWSLWTISFGPEHFDASMASYLSRANGRVFVLFDGEELAGMSSFMGIDKQRGVLEIGGTYYRPKFRGTGLNDRVKDMMLSRAFGCGARRVEFRVDSRNARSQAAMAKIGAAREGVLRADRITWTGHVRDTVLFAILREEWAS